MRSDRRRGPSGEVRAALALALGCAAVAWSGSAGAFDVKKAPSGSDVRWYDSAVTYHLDPSVGDAASGAADAIGAAAHGWSGLDGAPALSVVDGGGGSAPGYDGLNTIFFAPEGSTLTGGALAVTVFTFDSNGHALDTDIVINGRHSFAVLPSGSMAPSDSEPISNEGDGPQARTALPFDLHHVIAHELGHSLGLADQTDDHSALMFLYTAPGASSPRSPESDDAAGIASLYATTRPTTGGCGGSSVSPRGPSRAATRVALAVALSLVAWVVVRARRRSMAKPLALSALALAVIASLPAERAARPAPRASTSSARARVTHAETTVDSAGLFTTHASLSTTKCRVMQCPREATVDAYGGTIGGVHQEVAGVIAPRAGDDVEIALEDALAPLEALDLRGGVVARAAVRIVGR